MKDTFLLVDGNSLMHRAFHALPLMDADGVYTNAIYGFLSMLLKVIKEENVQYLAVCFDEHGPTFRHTVYADYKAGRKETPPELRQQFSTILTLLDEGRATDDETRRKAIYGEIQTLVHDHCYYLPLFYGSGTVAWRQGVEGIVVRDNARHEFTYVRAAEK